MQPTTPRRSSRINQQSLAVGLVGSYRSGYTYYWPESALPSSQVKSYPKPNDREGKWDIDYYSTIHRQHTASDRSEMLRIGDVVLVNTRRTSYPSIGVIVAMWQVRTVDGNAVHGNDGSPRVRVHWFVQPSEMARIRAHRDHAANEIYYSLNSSAVVSPSDLLDKCFVSNIVTDPDDTNGRTFSCLSALDSVQGTFYFFDWNKHRAQVLRGLAVNPGAWCVEPLESLIDDTPRKNLDRDGDQHSSRPLSRKRQHRGGLIFKDRDQDSQDDDDMTADPKTPTKSRKRLRGAPSSFEIEEHVPPASVSRTSPSESSVGAPSPLATSVLSSDLGHDHRISSEGQERAVPHTPSKRSSSKSTITPRRRAAPTPHSKAALKARVETKRRRISQQIASQKTFTEAIDLGHLPEDARLRAMHVLHVGSRPEALPCREEEYTDILGKVLELLEEGAGGCLYISGVPGTGKTATVHAVVRELKRMAERGESNPFTYVEVNGLKIPEPSAAYGVLWGALSGPDIAAEGHLKIAPKEALRKLDRYFSGNGRDGPGSHACVVLMDELDQLVTKKQDVVYNFFNWPSLANSKLIVLAVANTMDLPERVMSGKVRSRLGMERVDFRPYSRSQLETIVNSRLVTATDGLEVKPQEVMDPDGVKFAAMKVSAISGDARRVLDICRRAVEVSHAHNKAGPVGAKDVGLVITEMQNSPTAAYLRECSFHERIMLAATWKCLKRVGVSVIKWSEVAHQHGSIALSLADDLDSQRRPSPTELTLVLDSLTAARALLIEDPRKGLPDGDRKIMLNLEETEVLRVFGEAGQSWRTFLGI